MRDLRRFFVSRFLAALLSVSIACPAYALRATQEGTGLEELQKSLAGLEEVRAGHPEFPGGPWLSASVLQEWLERSAHAVTEVEWSGIKFPVTVEARLVSSAAALTTGDGWIPLHRAHDLDVGIRIALDDKVGKQIEEKGAQVHVMVLVHDRFFQTLRKHPLEGTVVEKINQDLPVKMTLKTNSPSSFSFDVELHVPTYESFEEANKRLVLQPWHRYRSAWGNGGMELDKAIKRYLRTEELFGDREIYKKWRDQFLRTTTRAEVEQLANEISLSGRPDHLAALSSAAAQALLSSGLEESARAIVTQVKTGEIQQAAQHLSQALKGRTYPDQQKLLESVEIDLSHQERIRLVAQLNPEAFDALLVSGLQLLWNGRDGGESSWSDPIERIFKNGSDWWVNQAGWKRVYGRIPSDLLPGERRIVFLEARGEPPQLVSWTFQELMEKLQAEAREGYGRLRALVAVKDRPFIFVNDHDLLYPVYKQLQAEGNLPRGGAIFLHWDQLRHDDGASKRTIKKFQDELQGKRLPSTKPQDWWRVREEWLTEADFLKALAVDGSIRYFLHIVPSDEDGKTLKSRVETAVVALDGKNVAVSIIRVQPNELIEALLQIKKQQEEHGEPFILSESIDLDFFLLNEEGFSAFSQARGEMARNGLLPQAPSIIAGSSPNYVLPHRVPEILEKVADILGRTSDLSGLEESELAGSPERGSMLDQIRVILPVTAGRRGDVSQVITLGRILRRAFPQSEVELQLAAGNRRNAGMVLRNMSQDPKFRIVNLAKSSPPPNPTDRSVSVTYLPEKKGARFERYITSSKVNLYIFEPDLEAEVLYVLPKGWSFNQVFKDAQGRLHLPLTTGFGPDSLGILFDPEFPEGPIDKEHLWEELVSGREIPDGLTSKVLQSEWSLLYYFYSKSWAAYLDLLGKILEEGSLRTRNLTMFDMTEFARPAHDGHVKLMEGFRDQIQPDMTHIYWNAEGKYREIRGLKYPDVRVIHVGPRQQELFKRLLSATTFPVFVTGSASVSEAIQRRKRWIYEAPPWKKRAIFDWARAALRFLPEDEASRLISLYGFSREEVEGNIRKPDVDWMVELREWPIKYPKDILVNPAVQTAMDHLNDALMTRHSLADRLIPKLKELAVAAGLEEGRFKPAVPVYLDAEGNRRIRWSDVPLRERRMIVRLNREELQGKVFLSGGFVRDLLLGREPSDVDLMAAQDAPFSPIEIRDLYLNPPFELWGELSVDEGDPHLGKETQIDILGWKANLSSRAFTPHPLDFSFNQMLLGFDGKEDPLLLDFFGGYEDLFPLQGPRRGRLVRDRIVPDDQQFLERFLRFAQDKELALQIDRASLQQIEQPVLRLNERLIGWPGGMGLDDRGGTRGLLDRFDRWYRASARSGQEESAGLEEGVVRTIPEAMRIIAAHGRLEAQERRLELGVMSFHRQRQSQIKRAIELVEGPPRPAVILGAGSLEDIPDSLWTSGKFSSWIFVDLVPEITQTALQARIRDLETRGLVTGGIWDHLHLVQADISGVSEGFLNALDEIIDAASSPDEAALLMTQLLRDHSDHASSVIDPYVPTDLGRLVLQHGAGLVISSGVVGDLARGIEQAIRLRVEDKFRLQHSMFDEERKERAFMLYLYQYLSYIEPAHAHLIHQLLHPEGRAYLASILLKAVADRSDQIRGISRDIPGTRWTTVAQLVSELETAARAFARSDDTGAPLEETTSVSRDRGIRGALLNSRHYPWQEWRELFTVPETYVLSFPEGDEGDFEVKQISQSLILQPRPLQPPAADAGLEEAGNRFGPVSPAEELRKRRDRFRMGFLAAKTLGHRGTALDLDVAIPAVVHDLQKLSEVTGLDFSEVFAKTAVVGKIFVELNREAIRQWAAMAAPEPIPVPVEQPLETLLEQLARAFAELDHVISEPTFAQTLARFSEIPTSNPQGSVPVLLKRLVTNMSRALEILRDRIAFAYGRNPDGAVASLADIRDQLSPRYGARVVIEIPPDAEAAQVAMTSGRLFSLINNLVDDAVKHSAPGQPVRMALAVEREMHELKITVSDQGAGIPADYFVPTPGGLIRLFVLEGRNGRIPLGLPEVWDTVGIAGGRLAVETFTQKEYEEWCSRLGASSLIFSPQTKEVLKGFYPEIQRVLEQLAAFFAAAEEKSALPSTEGLDAVDRVLGQIKENISIDADRMLLDHLLLSPKFSALSRDSLSTIKTSEETYREYVEREKSRIRLTQMFFNRIAHGRRTEPGTTFTVWLPLSEGAPLTSPSLRLEGAGGPPGSWLPLAKSGLEEGRAEALEKVVVAVGPTAAAPDDLDQVRKMLEKTPLGDHFLFISAEASRVDLFTLVGQALGVKAERIVAYGEEEDEMIRRLTEIAQGSYSIPVTRFLPGAFQVFLQQLLSYLNEIDNNRKIIEETTRQFLNSVGLEEAA